MNASAAPRREHKLPRRKKRFPMQAAETVPETSVPGRFAARTGSFLFCRTRIGKWRTMGPSSPVRVRVRSWQMKSMFVLLLFFFFCFGWRDC